MYFFEFKFLKNGNRPRLLIYLLLVPPLVECRRGLVVLEALEDGTVDHNLKRGRGRRTMRERTKQNKTRGIAEYNDDNLLATT